VEEEDQLLWLEGFRDVVVRPAAECLERLVRSSVGGHHQHGGRRLELDDLREDLQTVASRHPDVTENHVEGSICNDGERCIRTLGRLDLVAFILEQKSQARSKALFIINDQ
jgi:hypothetical protein